MPIHHRGRLINLDQRLTRMTLGELVRYEELLWRWMDKTGGAASIARQLNMIHREVEWRATDTVPGQRSRRVGQGSR
jgi:hypothetical protein